MLTTTRAKVLTKKRDNANNNKSKSTNKKEAMLTTTRAKVLTKKRQC